MACPQRTPETRRPGHQEGSWVAGPRRRLDGVSYLLQRADLLRLRALGAPHRGVLHPLVVSEAAVPVGLDRGVVHEDVRRAIVGGDETKALVRVEPLHCSLSHYVPPC